jgi:predicted MFS family arabinose efflux permease
MTFFGSSDPIDVAITSQLVTISSGASVIVGLLLCFLTVKYDHKKLLVLGVLCIPVGALGCSLAPNFIFMQIFYTIEGIGTAIAGVMNLVLLGEMLPLNDKPKATGWVMSGGAFANIAGNLVISFFFKDPGSWRAFLLWFALPISLIALAAAYFGVPSITQKRTEKIGKGGYLNAFKQIFRNRSAAACLIGNMLGLISMMWGIYYLAFFRAELGLSIADGALVAVGAIIVGTSGRIIGGYFVNRIGRKRLPVITMVFEGLTLPLLAFVPELWIAVVILYSNNFIGSFGNPALINLILEQVPESRGTIMSINNVFVWLGTTIGAGIGGFVLAMFNYTGIFIVFALLILITAGFLFFLTEDPCKTKETDSLKPTLL